MKSKFIKLAAGSAYRGVLPDKQVDEMLEIKLEDKMTPEKDHDERLGRLRELDLKQLHEMIDQNIERYEAEKLKDLYIEFILEFDLDLKDAQWKY